MLGKDTEGVDEKQYYMAIALMDQIYWIIGSVLGSVAGALITFDTTGIDFAMTALFIVILLSSGWRQKTICPPWSAWPLGLSAF